VVKKPPTSRIALSVFVLVLVLVLVPTAFADKGGNGGGGKPAGGTTSASPSGKPSGGGGTSGCTASAPRASIDNTWAWGSPGSWGMPGQQLKYAIDVFNNDVGCGSSSFTVTFSAPDGFAVSMPSSTITLNSASTGYVWAYVTSPAGAAAGDYGLTATVQRGATGSSSNSWYKVYTSDTVAPKLYWENPADGSAISGRTANIGFASSDDHAVKTLDLYIDGTSIASTSCDNISSDCQLSYSWAIRRVHGQHTATFKSTDWMGNVASDTATFSVN
jgi:Bacterial Ig domain